MCWFCQELCRHGQVPRAAAAWRNARRPIRKLDAVCAIKTIIIQCCYASLLFFPSKIQTSSRTLNTQTSSRTRFPCLTYICPLWKPSFTWCTEMSVLHLHVNKQLLLLFSPILIFSFSAFFSLPPLCACGLRSLEIKVLLDQHSAPCWRAVSHSDDSW